MSAIHSRASGALAEENDRSRVIVPDTQCNLLLTSYEKEKLSIQQKLLNCIEKKCPNANALAAELFHLFRSCGPDEFGHVGRAAFVDTLCTKFGLSQEEATKFFGMGDIYNNLELNYDQFRSLFRPVNKSSNLSMKAQSNTSRNAYRPEDSMWKAKSYCLANMSAVEREKFKLCSKVNFLIEQEQLR